MRPHPVAPPSLDLSHLTSSINYLGSIILTLVFDNLAERVFNGGVVALDKVAIDELYSERRFA